MKGAAIGIALPKDRWCPSLMSPALVTILQVQEDDQVSWKNRSALGTVGS